MILTQFPVFLATTVSLLCICLPTSVATGAGAAQLAGAKWIWHGKPGASVNAPAGKWYFRCGMDIPGDRPIKSAVCTITADNAFTLYINGKNVNSGDNWLKPCSFDAKASLVAGKNVLAVEAINWKAAGDNPAGLIASLRVEFSTGAPLVVRTDQSWKSSSAALDGWQTPDFDDSNWANARVIDWDGWGAVAVGEGTLGTFDPLIEPETRTLTAEEGDEVIRAEWLFQAEGKALDQRAVQESQWARAIVARLAKSQKPPSLDAELAALDALDRNAGGLSPEALYLAVRRVKRQLMFKDPLVDFSRLVFIDAPQRYEHESMHRVYPQAQLNSVRLLLLDGLHPAGTIRKATEELGPGWYWRPDVSYDGKRVAFCFRPEKDKTFHLYEVNTEGTGLRQLTDSSYDDQDPVYLPDGRLAFVSNRGCSHARCVVGHPSTVVARCDSDGSNIYLISASNEPEYTPAVMHSGRILYTRWEYTDKELMRIQSLWTMNPDGTGVSVFWGNQSYWPDLLMEARPIPGSNRVMFAGHGHHNVYWGSIGIIDHSKGFNYPDGLTKVTVDVPWCEVGDGPQETPETPGYHTAGAYRGYKSPYPLSEEVFLVSARHAGDKSKYQIFLMDIYGNREVIYEGAFHALYAMPIKPRPTPPVMPDRINWAGPQQDGGKIEPGTFYNADVYEGTPEILRGKAKYLRVIQLDYNTMTIGKKYQDAKNTASGFHMHAGPVVSAVVNDGVKKVLGTVAIEADNSVFFEVPPCVPLHLQLLDEQHRTLHTMRSFTSVMPGENRGCVGCHESQVSSPPGSMRTLAISKPPAILVPYTIGPNYSLGYERDIQPILDRYCGKCHQGDGKGRAKLDLTLRPSTDGGVFPEPYLTLTLGKKRQLADFPSNCEGGIAGTILAENRPWRPADYGTLPPMTALSFKSKLVDIASSGKHHDVKVDPLSLTKLILWVDTLCTYRGERELRSMADPDPNDPLFKQSNYPPSDPTIKDVYAESPYRPRMRTAPIVNRAYRQDEFPSTESRLPRDGGGTIIPPVTFDPAEPSSGAPLTHGRLPSGQGG